MKNILFLFLIFFSIECIAQSYTFDNVQETTYENREWGRWVYCPDDVLIENNGSGYTIKIYAYGGSHPAFVISCSYSNMDNNWFVYTITSSSVNGQSIPLYSIRKKYIKASTKLSSMSRGYKGSINIWMGEVGVAYYCID